MWLCLNDAFLSIVRKDCGENSLLVRARRQGDIEKVFGRRVQVTRSTDSDYLYRAVVPQDDVVRAMENEVARIDYGNFKDSVADGELHDAYLKIWTAMAALQNPRPYSEPYRAKAKLDITPPWDENKIFKATDKIVYDEKGPWKPAKIYGKLKGKRRKGAKAQ